MRVGQSRFKQKSTSDQSINNLTNLLECFKSCQDVSQSQRDYFRMYKINSFLIALLKAQKIISDQSIVKNVSCRPASSEAMKYLSQLDGAQVKASIMKNMFSDIKRLTINLDQLKQSIVRSSNRTLRQKCFKKQEVVRLTNLWLLQLLENMKIDLKSGFRNKQIYGLINFEWTTEFVTRFTSYFNQQYQNQAQLQQQIKKIKDQLKGHQKINQTQNKINKNVDLILYQKMSMPQLLKHILNQKIAQLIQKQLQNLGKGLIDKQKECIQLKSKVDQYEQIIKKQMSLLNQQEEQKKIMRNQLLLSESQLQILNQKCEFIQKQLQEMSKQIQFVNRNPQVNKPDYYINPLWQKQQLQQKYYVQIIQLQSDLLIQKQQTQSLVNIVLEEIKLSHQFFKDFSAPAFMICRFDSEVLKLLKTTTAFDKINLDEYLVVREEVLGSESSPSMYKSTISTISEVDNQFRMRSERQIQNFQNTQQEFKYQRQF